MVRLTVEEILVWADGHHAATGDWPGDGSGPVPDAACELTWSTINQALKLGRYGLGGDVAGPPADRASLGPASAVRRANPRLGRRLPRGAWPLALQ